MSKRILAVSPIPANLVLAACYREHWDSIRIVSRKLVIGELGRYAEIDGLSRVTFFLDGVENSAEARKKLQGLARKKVAIEWVSARSSEEIKSACREIAGVEFRESTSQEEFLASVGAMKVSDRALFRALREPSGDLHDFLRYKLNLALMAGFDLKPLIEAIDQMVAFKEDGWFNVSRLP